jgi:hypothetical protein
LRDQPGHMKILSSLLHPEIRRPSAHPQPLCGRTHWLPRERLLHQPLAVLSLVPFAHARLLPGLDHAARMGSVDPLPCTALHANHTYANVGPALTFSDRRAELPTTAARCSQAVGTLMLSSDAGPLGPATAAHLMVSPRALLRCAWAIKRFVVNCTNLAHTCCNRCNIEVSTCSKTLRIQNTMAVGNVNGRAL